MRRFYIPQLGRLVSGQQVILDADQAHHARRVLRLGPDVSVELFDGLGAVAKARIIQWCDDGKADLKIDALEQVARRGPLLELAVAFPKGKRVDDMVNQLCQLGVDRLTPLLTERASVTPRSSKIQRLGKQVIEATRQSGRAYMMTIDPPVKFKDVLEDRADLKLLADLGSDAAAPIVCEDLSKMDRLMVLIGPEGGWTDEERTAAQQAGARSWSLGPHIMRIETAAVAAAAILGNLIHSR